MISDDIVVSYMGNLPVICIGDIPIDTDHVWVNRTGKSPEHGQS